MRDVTNKDKQWATKTDYFKGDKEEKGSERVIKENFSLFTALCICIL